MKANRSLYFRQKWYDHHYLRKCRCAFGAFGVTIQTHSIFPNSGRTVSRKQSKNNNNNNKTSGKEKKKKKQTRAAAKSAATVQAERYHSEKQPMAYS